MKLFGSLIVLFTLSSVNTQRVFPSPSNCGGFGGGGVGGIEALPGEFPYMFAIGWKSAKNDSDYIYKCGGSMIAQQWILTAAHCLYDSDDLPVVVRAGGDGLNETHKVIIKIDEIIEHPEYEYPSTYNDIAILRLAANDRFQFAVLPDGDAHLNENLTAIGYGNTKFAGAPSEKLLKVFLSVVSVQECSRHYEPDASSLHNGIVDTQLCAGDPNRIMDTCQGDSGGPLLRRELGKHFIMGITSFGIGCNNGPPGVYTNVKKYLGWIESVIRPWYNEEYPYMVSLNWQNHTSCKWMTEKCGAVQISWNFLLIAAHCLYEFDEIPYFYREAGYNKKYKSVLITDARTYIFHPDYKHPSPYNDLALIKLISLEPFAVTPIWLNDTLANNTLTYVNCAESENDQFMKQDLLKTTLSYVPNSLCRQIYENDYFARNFSRGIDSTHLCANDTEQLWDLNKGYADGPLIMHTNVEGVRSPYLVGMASFGVNCEGCPPAVFTRISRYIDWIQAIVWPTNKTEPPRDIQKINLK